jgi:hypothetical protein
MWGRQVGTGVLAGQVGRGEDPLPGGQQRGVGAAEVLAALGGDPAGVGGDPDLVGARVAVVADDRAHGVAAVPDVVAGDQRRAAADLGGVEPVVVVVEGAAAEVAAVLADQRRVVELHPGVDVGDHDAVAAVAKGRPDLRGADAVDVPLDRLDARLLLGRGRPGDLDAALGDHPLDLREGGDLGQQLRPGGHPDRVGDPEGLVVDLAGTQERAQPRLAAVGVGAQPLVDRGRPVGMPAEFGGRRQVGAVAQDHEEGGGALGGGLVEDPAFHLVERRGLRRGGGAALQRDAGGLSGRQQHRQGDDELDGEQVAGAAASA